MTSEPERKKAKTDHEESLPNAVADSRVKELQDKILVLKEEYPELECIDQSRLHGCLDEAYVKYKSEQNNRHCPIYKLPNEILQKCFEYVGSKSYLFTATVSKKFYETYTDRFTSEYCTGRETSYRYGASSTSLAKYCVETCCETQDEETFCETQDGKDQIFIAGAVNGNVEILEYALEEGYDLLPIINYSSLEDWQNEYKSSVIARIAGAGHFHVLKYLYEKANFRLGMQLASNEAIGGGHLDILEWLNSIGCLRERDTGEFCREASFSENIDILKWLIERGYDTSYIDEDVLRLKDIELLDYCLSKGVEFEEEAINTIAYSDDVEFAEHCKEKSLQMTSDAYFNAIDGGYFEMVKYLYRSGIPWNSTCTAHMTRARRLDMLKFARENNCPWHPKTSAYAAKCSDLEILQYLYTHGCPWHPDTFKEFILGEKPTAKVFRFLHEKGCPWDKDFSRSILQMKSISLLTCLHESGLSYENDLLALALRQRWLNGVKYIIESDMKCESPADLGTVIAPGNFRCHDFEILKYLKSAGMEWSIDQSLHDLSPLLEIAYSDKFDDNFEVFKWAIESGCPFDESNHSLYSLTGLFSFRLDVMKYLLSTKCPGVGYCYEYALENQQVEIVKLLYEGHNKFKRRDLFDIAFKQWFKDPSNQKKRDILTYLQRQGCPQNNTFDRHHW